jgi:uncharacterized protein
MSLIGEQVLLRIYLQSADRAPHTPTYQRIIKAARQNGLAGATVLRGLPENSHFSLVEHAQIVVEIVDSAEKISRFISDSLDKLMLNGIATLERAAVMMYRHGKDKPHALELLAMPPPLSTLPQIQPRPNMTIKENGVLLRVFIGESDRFEHKPLHEVIVRKARELGLAGATVLRGTEGFGANSVVHKASLLEMSTDLPIVIELVDAEDKVKLLLPHLETMVTEGMITMEHVMIVLYRHG